MGAKQIATDIGVSRNAVYQHIERLRRQGALAETYTPSGQPPRRLDVGSVAALASSLPPRDSALARLRELPGGGGRGRVRGADRGRDRRRRRGLRSPTSSGASTRAGESGLPADLVSLGAAPALGAAAR